MQFITLEPEEFTKFAAESPYKSFMQTAEIARLREQDGWTAYYLGVTDGGELRAASMLVARPTFLGKSTFIAPGGPLIDLADTQLTIFFFQHLRSYLKSHNGYILHVDPYYELIERDRDGQPVEGGFDHQSAIVNLTRLGFRPAASTQPKYLFVMDLNGRTEAELLADLKRNTRNHIRKAEKMGVTVRTLARDELNIFKQITESTSNRRHFTDRPLSYYEQMYDLFAAKGEVEFLVAEATIDDRTVPLSAAMFILYGTEVIYLFSGSDEQYMRDYNAQYAIQWHIIKTAAAKGFKRYNFYGIHALPSDDHPDGIYEFKKGFDTKYGHVVELIGSYELPVSQPFYHLHHLLAKLKHR